MGEENEDREIEELNISDKTKKVLRKIGIRYIRQLESIDIRRIHKLVILGDKYLEELEEQLYMLDVEPKDKRDYDNTMNKFEKWRQENATRNLAKKSYQDTERKESNENSEDKDKNHEDRDNESKGER